MTDICIIQGYSQSSKQVYSGYSALPHIRGNFPPVNSELLREFLHSVGARLTRWLRATFPHFLRNSVVRLGDRPYAERRTAARCGLVAFASSMA